MKKHKIKFIKNVAWILILILILTTAFNFCYKKMLFEKKLIYRSEKMFQDFISNPQEQEVDYIFFGDSHTNKGLNPEFVPNSFNYGMPAENYLMTFFKLKKILEHDKVRPKKIVLQVSLHTFSESSRDTALLQNELHFYSKYLPYSEFKKISEDSFLSYWIKSRLLFIGKSDDLQQLLNIGKRTEMYLGWSKSEGNFSLAKNKAETAKQTAELHFKGRKMISNQSLEYFLKTVKLAKDNNITIYFMTYPTTKEYDEGIKKLNISKEDFYELVFKEANAVGGGNYVWLDYYNLFFDHSEYFNDPHHLNYHGAEIFSKKIWQDLKRHSFAREVFTEDSLK